MLVLPFANIDFQAMNIHKYQIYFNRNPSVIILWSRWREQRSKQFWHSLLPCLQHCT